MPRVRHALRAAEWSVIVSTRFRVRRVAKWAGLVSSCSIATAWMLTTPAVLERPLQAYGQSGRVFAAVTYGRFTLNLESRYLKSTLPKDWGVIRADDRLLQPPARISYGLILPASSSDRFWTDISIPLWLPLLIVAMPTAFFWYRDRRRPPPGHCPKCGYNLTFNESGCCPECGTECAVA